MIADIRKLMAGEPFVAVSIHRGDGNAIPVPAFDPLPALPHGSRGIVASEGGKPGCHLIPPLLINHLTVDDRSPISTPDRSEIGRSAVVRGS